MIATGACAYNRITVQQRSSIHFATICLLCCTLSLCLSPTLLHYIVSAQSTHRSLLPRCPRSERAVAGIWNGRGGRQRPPLKGSSKNQLGSRQRQLQPGRGVLRLSPSQDSRALSPEDSRKLAPATLKFYWRDAASRARGAKDADTRPAEASVRADSAHGPTPSRLLRAKPHRPHLLSWRAPPYSRFTNQLIIRGGRVLLTEILLPRIARRGTVCLISIRG